MEYPQDRRDRRQRMGGKGGGVVLGGGLLVGLVQWLGAFGNLETAREIGAWGFTVPPETLLLLIVSAALIFGCTMIGAAIVPPAAERILFWWIKKRDEKARMLALREVLPLLKNGEFHLARELCDGPKEIPKSVAEILKNHDIVRILKRISNEKDLLLCTVREDAKAEVLVEENRRREAMEEAFSLECRQLSKEERSALWLFGQPAEVSLIPERLEAPLAHLLWRNILEIESESSRATGILMRQDIIIAPEARRAVRTVVFKGRPIQRERLPAGTAFYRLFRS